MACTLHATRLPGGNMRVTFQNAVAHAVPCWPAASLSPALKRCPCAAWATPACRTRRRCRQLMQRPDGSHAALALWAAGGLAGAVSWFSVYPFDVLKTRLQAAAAASSPYKGGPAGQLHACGGRSKVASIALVEHLGAKYSQEIPDAGAPPQLSMYDFFATGFSQSSASFADRRLVGLCEAVVCHRRRNSILPWPVNNPWPSFPSQWRHLHCL